MSLKTAGVLATTFTFAASMARIPGGKLADRFGARSVVSVSLIAIGYGLTCVCYGPPLPIVVTLVFASGVAMGVGMAGVFRYIPDYFPTTVGAVGGVVGALGGLGGFFLPQISSMMKLAFRNPFLQMLPLAALPVIAAAAQQLAIRRRVSLQSPLEAIASQGHEFDTLVK